MEFMKLLWISWILGHMKLLFFFALSVILYIQYKFEFKHRKKKYSFKVLRIGILLFLLLLLEKCFLPYFWFINLKYAKFCDIAVWHKLISFVFWSL